MKLSFKIINRINVLLLALTASTAVFSQNLAYLPPIYDLLLQESRLDKVLKAYSNPDSGHIFIAAHRGGREFDQQDGAPGNSIANIENAVSKGFDIYESDIEILGDGSLVVFHDDTFDMLTNGDPDNEMNSLDNATLNYAQSLFLTYNNGDESSQRIPTLEAFLKAAKGKVMVKFDLKSGTFGTSTLTRIFDAVVATSTTKQVLIRGGGNLLDVADVNGYDTRMIMRRYDSVPSELEINSLVNNYDVRAISIPSNNGIEVSIQAMDAAYAAGLMVEIHESQDAGTREMEWQEAIDYGNHGFRQFHSFKPSLLIEYLEENGYREF